jgi:alpha-D-ribose 1-methylphosphonate 5-triphosphate synthase subunit PhnH
MTAGTASGSPRALSIGGAFADPVRDSQATFRAVLDAMARPGRIVTPPLPVGPRPAGELSPAAAAVALTLVDFETPVWLDPTLGSAAPWLRFHCGAPQVEDPAKAAFAFARGPEALPALDQLDLGSEEYPDRSTTLVLEVAGLEAESGLRLTGPGIENESRLAVAGLAAGWWQARAALGILFPLGLDLILVAGDRLAALPRTTRVEA